MMKDKKQAQLDPELTDVREFAEMAAQLTDSERLQLKGIIIGMQIAREAKEAAAV
ncbi:MAG: hypothetical protein LUD50_03015 [Clostridia bacterium]|nr:hypothetical protein [Clostridia bacterium]